MNWNLNLKWEKIVSPRRAITPKSTDLGKTVNFQDSNYSTGKYVLFD
jgi:hypothetical protein